MRTAQCSVAEASSAGRTRGEPLAGREAVVRAPAPIWGAGTTERSDRCATSPAESERNHTAGTAERVFEFTQGSHTDRTRFSSLALGGTTEQPAGGAL